MLPVREVGGIGPPADACGPIRAGAFCGTLARVTLDIGPPKGLPLGGYSVMWIALAGVLPPYALQPRADVDLRRVSLSGLIELGADIGIEACGTRVLVVGHRMRAVRNPVALP